MGLWGLGGWEGRRLGKGDAGGVDQRFGCEFATGLVQVAGPLGGRGRDPEHGRALGWSWRLRELREVNTQDSRHKSCRKWTEPGDTGMGWGAKDQEPAVLLKKELPARQKESRGG